LSFGLERAKRLRRLAVERLKTADLTPEEREELEAIVARGPALSTVGDSDFLSEETLILGVVLFKLSKTPEGIKLIGQLGTEYLKGMFKTMSFLAQASAANKIAAWANPILISGVFERFGMLPKGFNTNYHLGITVISGVEMAADFVGDVLDALPWNLFKPPDPKEYPSHIVYAETGEVSEISYFPPFGAPIKKPRKEGKK